MKILLVALFFILASGLLAIALVLHLDRWCQEGANALRCEQQILP